MNIGVFGGTFDPPHTGHLIVAEHVRETFGLVKVHFVPSSVPPHKQQMDIVEAHHRLEMLQCAVQGNRFFDVSEVEIQRGGVSFTIETLQEFKRRFPDDVLYLLMGMDNLVEFHTWKMPGGILDLAVVVVMTRPNVDLTTVDATLRERIQVCVVPEIAISSTEIRRRVKEGRSIRYLVPAAVESYIIRNHLYR
jgi:nicotinate-nucleotide adenylyltransferase